MSQSTDITLPKGIKPIFPNKCIVCHSTPDSSIKIAQNSQNWLLGFLLPILMLFGWSRVELPICRGCKGRFRLQRWGRELICWTLVLIAIWWLMPQFKGWSGITRKLAVGALVLVAISPYILAEVIWPRIFDTTAQGDKVDYSFASLDYAAEFHALNRSQITASDAGPTAPSDGGDQGASGWYETKSSLMEGILGLEHDRVMHAIIPYAVGGGLDLYYYPHSIPGTAVATKELSELPAQGSSNRAFSCYELAMFTRYPINLEEANDDRSSFGKAHSNIKAILNRIAPYSAQVTLNPHETCEFPAEMERVGGKCLIFDAYSVSSAEQQQPFGVLAIIEIFRSEMAFARENGGTALLSLLKQGGFYPYSDLDREPVA